MASRNKAFTLVELLAVIGILALLAGLVYTGVEKSIERAKVTRTSATIESLSTALVNFGQSFVSFDVDVGGEQFPTGLLDDDNKRIRLVRMLSGRELQSDGSFKIATKIREDPNWDGPYLEPKLRELQPKNKREFRQGQLVDAWGNPLMIRIKRGNYDKMMKHRPDSFEIWSWGPNEANEIDKRGFGDDITNWE